jgi:DNA primase
MSQNRQALDQAKEQLKGYLPTYLSAMGINLSGKTFCCINPDHPDKNPSCGLVPQSGDRLFHCFSCHAVGDIFVAAHFLEGKPLVGPGFITENLMYLAMKYGVDVPDMPELSPEDLKIMEAHQMYLHAAMVVKNSPWGERVAASITERCWPKDVCQRLGVGSVVSYEDYLQRMTGMYGHKREALKSVGLDKKSMFNENMLIFTVRDEHGAPVGFACRNLRYEEEKDRYAKQVAELTAQHGEGTAEAKAEISKLFRPTKYVNTSEANPIYNKSRLLFNFCEGRKYAPPLWIFEGYPDGVTAYAGGLTNSCAIGATAFTEQHLELLLSLKIKHIIIVLDADEFGQDAMERIVEMLKTMGGHPGLTVELVSMPEGTDDPDAFARKAGNGDLRKGMQIFRQLPRMDMFAWSLRQAIKEGKEPTTLAEETIPMIVNEVNNLKRMTMIKKLAEQTSLNEVFLIREVQRQLDADLMALEEEKVLLAKKAAADLNKNPGSMQVILENYRHRIEVLEKRKSGYDPVNVRGAIRATFERAEKNTKHTELATGYEMLDRVMGGLPRSDVFISLPGKPNQGKTTFLHNLAHRLPERNEDCMVFFHSVDDALSAAIPRLLAAKFDVPSDYFKKPNFWRNQVEDFNKMYAQAQDWLEGLLDDEKLIIVDVETLPNSLAAYEIWVRTLRNKYPSREIVCMGDNFHLYELAGYEPGEGKTRAMSAFIKRLANTYHTTQMFTTELPKEALRAGVRPRIGKIKGTSGVAYDANVNFGIYNDLKDRAEKATIFWDGHNETVYGPHGEQHFQPQRMPVIELVIDKSKISSFDGTIYFNLNPDSAHLEECNEMDQHKFRSLAGEYHASANDMSSSHAPYQAHF